MVKTIDSHHWLRKYPNLIAHLSLSAPEQLWVSDITYIRTLEGFSYLCLITDAYSRKIVGYALHPNLEAVGCIAALKMAVDSRKRISPFILIHHSDRGIQYCSQNYTALLNEDRIAISMTQSGSPYENALAERVNEIIKNEFFPKKVYQNHKEAKKSIVVINDVYIHPLSTQGFWDDWLKDNSINATFAYHEVGLRKLLSFLDKELNLWHIPEEVNYNVIVPNEWRKLNAEPVKDMTAKAP